MAGLELDMLRDLVKETKNEFAEVVDKMPTKFSYIDTGSYALNAVVSGSIHGGLVDDAITGFAGEEATGKTFFTIAAIKQFLDDNPTGMVAYFYSEGKLNPSIFTSRGIDPKRVAVIYITTIEEFRTQAARMLDKYNKTADGRPPLVFALDSLGMCSTNKEVTDVTDGNDKRDMTRTQLIRGAFRVLSSKMGIHNVPLLVANHIYMKTGVSFGDPREMSGGGGLKYAASTIIMLSKSQYKEKSTDKKISGAKIKCTVTKSRFTREKLSVDVLLHHERGLDRYYGLLPIAEAAGVVKKVSTRYQMPDGAMVFENAINKDGAKYWTEEMLKAIDDYTKEFWVYGGSSDNDEEDDECLESE